MISAIKPNKINSGTPFGFGVKNKTKAETPTVVIGYVSPVWWALGLAAAKKGNVAGLSGVVPTSLSSKKETEMYNSVVNAFVNSSENKLSPQDGESRAKKLDKLLKSGILLNKNSNDGTSVLESIYKTINTKRAVDMDGVKIAGQIVDTLYNPAIITQRFGDIPKEAEAFVMKNAHDVESISSTNISSSGVCASASIEFSMANKRPAEFARWAESLTSPELSVKKHVALSSLSNSPLTAAWLLNEFKVQTDKFGFSGANLTLKPDSNAIVRDVIQDNYWDRGERSILDVLMQSTLMNLASQNTYNSLTDTVNSKFNANKQGLIEFEKTFAQTIAFDMQIESIVYQNVDEDQNLLGWNCDFGTIQKHITDTIDSGEDVILGYVLTASDCGESSDNPNKIVNGHEITVTGYRKDSSGNIIFICNDTDDDSPNFVEYTAEYLLPKIHHAGYPSQIVSSGD